WPLRHAGAGRRHAVPGGGDRHGARSPGGAQQADAQRLRLHVQARRRLLPRAHCRYVMLQSLLTGISRKTARHHRSKPFRMRNQTPLVSFTFDDVPDSAYLNGASILEECGIRGTFYIAAGTCGTQDTDAALTQATVPTMSPRR